MGKISGDTAKGLITENASGGSNANGEPISQPIVLDE
jgi:hypothetical protein